jgi:hypothetical protein
MEFIIDFTPLQALLCTQCIPKSRRKSWVALDSLWSLFP